MLLHETAALIIIYSQPVGNYNRWREAFLHTMGKFSLEGHVLSDVHVRGHPHWGRMDCVVHSWLLGTISTDLVEIVVERSAIACATWLAIKTQFLDNRETRTVVGVL